MTKNYFSLPLFALLLANQQANAQACLPTFQYGADSNMITNVQFANINNTSPFTSGTTNVYEDFTAQSATFNAGDSFPISIKGPSSTFPSDVMVYVDFNQNGSFSDQGEGFYAGRITPANPANAATITTQNQDTWRQGQETIRIKISSCLWNYISIEEPPAQYCVSKLLISLKILSLFVSSIFPCGLSGGEQFTFFLFDGLIPIFLINDKLYQAETIP